MFQVVWMHPVIDSGIIWSYGFWLDRLALACQIVGDRLSCCCTLSLWYVYIYIYQSSVVVMFSLDCLILCGWTLIKDSSDIVCSFPLRPLVCTSLHTRLYSFTHWGCVCSLKFCCYWWIEFVSFKPVLLLVSVFGTISFWYFCRLLTHVLL